MSDFESRLKSVQSNAQSLLSELNNGERTLKESEIALLRMLGWRIPKDISQLESGWLVNVMKWGSTTWSTKHISSD